MKYAIHNITQATFSKKNIESFNNNKNVRIVTNVDTNKSDITFCKDAKLSFTSPSKIKNIESIYVRGSLYVYGNYKASSLRAIFSLIKHAEEVVFVDMNQPTDIICEDYIPYDISFPLLRTAKDISLKAHSVAFPVLESCYSLNLSSTYSVVLPALTSLGGATRIDTNSIESCRSIELPVLITNSSDIALVAVGTINAPYMHYSILDARPLRKLDLLDKAAKLATPIEGIVEKATEDFIAANVCNFIGKGIVLAQPHYYTDSIEDSLVIKAYLGNIEKNIIVASNHYTEYSIGFTSRKSYRTYVDQTCFPVRKPYASVQEFDLLNNVKYLYADSLFNKVIEKKIHGSITLYKTSEIATSHILYVVCNSEGLCAHGYSMKEAFEELKYKINKSYELAKYIKHENITETTKIPLNKAKLIYHKGAQACLTGVESWLRSNNIDAKEFTIADMLDVSEKMNTYNSDIFKASILEIFPQLAETKEQ